jgi:hypothetical protein
MGGLGDFIPLYIYMENQPLFTQDIEGVLEHIRVNCAILTEYHRKDFLKLNNSIKYYRIPVLLLSSVASVWSVSGTAFLEQDIVSLINCLLGLTAGTITSIELFVKLDEKMKLAEELSHKFYIISADIFKTLSLRDENRNQNGKDYLMETFSEYLKLIEKSNILDKKVKDQLLPLPDGLNPISLERSRSHLTIETPTNSESSV